MSFFQRWRNRKRARSFSVFTQRPEDSNTAYIKPRAVPAPESVVIPLRSHGSARKRPGVEFLLADIILACEDIERLAGEMAAGSVSPSLAAIRIGQIARATREHAEREL